MVLRPSLVKSIKSTFLRKKRRSPHSPFKTQWHYAFDQEQALQDLKKSALHSPSNSSHQGSEDSQNPCKSLPLMLNCLIDSFAAYNCEPTPNAYQFVIKTLIRNSQFDELTHVLSHLQNAEKFDTPERVFVDLIRAYGENGMLYESVDLFFRIPSFRKSEDDLIGTETSPHSKPLIL
uniref:Pentatricopeptide repeat-containing protein n=1 Tax=Opuntia streptacantha TaxID=393608 RepID=A0A7C8YL02_OPUST